MVGTGIGRVILFLVLAGFLPAQEREVYNTPKALRRRPGTEAKAPLPPPPTAPDKAKTPLHPDPAASPGPAGPPTAGPAGEIDLLWRQAQRAGRGKGVAKGRQDLPGKGGKSGTGAASARPAGESALPVEKPTPKTLPPAVEKPTPKAPPPAVEKPTPKAPSPPPGKPIPKSEEEKTSTSAPLPLPADRRALYPEGGAPGRGPATAPTPGGGVEPAPAGGGEEADPPAAPPSTEGAGSSRPRPEVGDFLPEADGSRVAAEVPGLIPAGPAGPPVPGANGEEAARLLERMLAARGGRQAFLELQALRLDMTITVFNEISSQLFSYRTRHDLLLGKGRSDRITLEEGLVIGRRGSAAWAEVDGVVHPERCGAAAQELQVMGFLARFPFVLGDRSRFEPVSVGTVRRGAVEVRELVLAERRTGGRVLHTLCLEPATLMPREMRYVNPLGRTITVLFHGVTGLEGVDLPRKREILAPGGESIAMEFDLIGVERGYFGPRHFLPEDG